MGLLPPLFYPWWFTPSPSPSPSPPLVDIDDDEETPSEADKLIETEQQTTTHQKIDDVEEPPPQSSSQFISFPPFQSSTDSSQGGGAQDLITAFPSKTVPATNTARKTDYVYPRIPSHLSHRQKNIMLLQPTIDASAQHLSRRDYCASKAVASLRAIPHKYRADQSKYIPLYLR